MNSAEAYLEVSGFERQIGKLGVQDVCTNYRIIFMPKWIKKNHERSQTKKSRNLAKSIIEKTNRSMSF